MQLDFKVWSSRDILQQYPYEAEQVRERGNLLWSVPTFCAHTSGESGSGTFLGLRLREKTSFEASKAFMRLDASLLLG